MSLFPVAFPQLEAVPYEAFAAPADEEKAQEIAETRHHLAVRLCSQRHAPQRAAGQLRGSSVGASGPAGWAPGAH